MSCYKRTVIRDFGEKGVRAQFFQDGRWQGGRAWEIVELPSGERRVNGRCRDYEAGGRMPLETHGLWPLEEVRGIEKHLAPLQQALDL